MPERSESSRDATAWAAFAACGAIWGSTFLLISIGNDALPPIWAATLRLALASVLLGALALGTGHPLPRGAALRAAAGFGFLNFGLNFSLLYWGECSVPSGLSAVLFATIPLSTALFARAFGLERLNRTRISGALIALAGVGVICSGPTSLRIPLVPLFAVLLAAVFAALSGVVLKLGPRQNPIAANAVAALVGFIVCLLLSFAIREPHPLPRTPAALLPVLYLTALGSVGAFVLFAWLVNRWPVTRISFIAVVVPLVALALGALVRHERLGVSRLMGSALVITGVIFGMRGGERHS